MVLRKSNGKFICVEVINRFDGKEVPFTTNGFGEIEIASPRLEDTEDTCIVRGTEL